MSEQKSGLDEITAELADKKLSLEQLKENFPDKVGFLPHPGLANRRVTHNGLKNTYPFGCYVIKEMLLLGADALFITYDGKVLLEQNAETVIEHSYTKTPRPMQPGSLALDRAVSLVSGATYNFYHWMMDSLPKIVVAESLGFDGVYVVPAANANPIVDASLDLMGVPPERRVRMEYGIAEVRELWLPTQFYGYKLSEVPEIFYSFRSRMLSSIQSRDTDLHRRIYIRRPELLNNRTVINAAEFEMMLSEFGFVTLELEGLSLADQIATFMGANSLIGVHGAGMLHSCWMPFESAVFEVFVFGGCFDTYYELMRHKIKYIEPQTHDEKYRVVIDCGACRKLLQENLD